MQKEEPDKISDAGLEPNEYLAITIGQSFTNKEISDDRIRTKDSEIWFFQVSQPVELNYTDLVLRAEDGTERDALEPQSGTNYQRLYDSEGEDILRVADNSWRVYHFSLGVLQNDIRVYPRIPDSQNGGGFDWLSGDQPSPAAGDKMGFIPSEKTGYADPSIKLETVAWKSDSRSVLQYGFYNENPDKPKKPKLNVKGYAYELRPVEQEDEMFKLFADLNRPKGKRKNAIRSVQFSNVSLRSFSFNVPEAWRDVENNLVVSKVNLPSEIEAALSKEESQKDEKEEGMLGAAREAADMGGGE